MDKLRISYKWSNMDNATPDKLCSMVGIRLKYERLRSGLSQAAMARKAGLSLTTFRRLERTGQGSIENLMALLLATGRQAAAALLFPEPVHQVSEKLRERAFAARQRKKDTV